MIVTASGEKYERGTCDECGKVEVMCQVEEFATNPDDHLCKGCVENFGWIWDLPKEQG